MISIEKSPGDLLEVFGMGSTGFQVNQRLGETGDFYSNILISVIEALNQAGIAEDMQSLDMTQPLSVNLESKDGYTIHLGQTEDLLDKLANLPAIISGWRKWGCKGAPLTWRCRATRYIARRRRRPQRPTIPRRPSRTMGKERKRPNRPQRPRRARPRPAIRKLRHSRQPHRVEAILTDRLEKEKAFPQIREIDRRRIA